MPQSSALAQTAPIAIAPKPPPSDFLPTGHPHHSQPADELLRGESYSNDVYTPGSSSSALSYSQSSLSPCAACAQRQSKCVVMSEDDANCEACQLNDTNCSLPESPLSRKRKVDDDAAGEQRQSKRSSPSRYDSHRNPHIHHSLSSTAASNSLLEEMANFGGPTMLSRTLGLQKDRYSQYIGPTTDFEPSLINLSTFDPQDESLLSRGTLRKVSENDTFLMLPDYCTPGWEHVDQDIEDIEALVAPYGHQLINLYFRVIHPAFPIIQKTVFLEKYGRSPREFSPPLLAAIYILALNWWDQDDSLANHPKPNVRELESIVRTTLADAMNRPKLSTVQAGLLLSQRPEGDQWAPTAQLIAIAQELGLHLDCSNWKIPVWERGLRKRLAWGMYMQDKWGALVHGRPSHIFSTQWAVQAIAATDFSEVEWEEGDNEDRLEIERGRTLFTQMVQLSQILAEIQDTFYTLQATQNVTNAGNQGTHLVLTLAKPIQLKLKEWYAAIPASIRMDSTYQTPSTASTSNTRLSSIGYLHLAYYATEITLHRRIIRSLAAVNELSLPHSLNGSLAAAAVAATSNHNNTNNKSISSSSNNSSGDSYLTHICRNAAKARLISAMDFVNRLTPLHLRAFWYFASKTNFALIGTFGSLLWATSPGREEAEWYRRRLGEYRWTLSVSANSSGRGAMGGAERNGGSGGGQSSASVKGLTEFAMGMLDISTGLLRKLPEKPSMSRQGSVTDILEGVRKQSLLALTAGGSGGGGGSGGEAEIARGAGYMGQQDGLDIMDEEDDGGSSEDDIGYSTFSATAGLASMR